MKIRLILWGIGKIYNAMSNLLRSYAALEQIEIVAVTAQDLPDFRMLDGFMLIRTEEIQNLEYDYLMVMSDDYFGEIANAAMSMHHVPREKIVSYRILEIPYFNFPKYDRIRKANVSIVSNNCWGGVLYNTLGMECTSPFKNVSFAPGDYIKILSDLRHYMSVDPIWTGKVEMDANQNREVPMLELDDVFIKCNHDPDAETAICNWKRRRGKFNWDNILVEMYAEEPEVEKAFGKVSEQFGKRICFVPYASEEDYSIQLPLMAGQTKFYETVISNARLGKNAMVYRILEIMDGCVKYRLG